jgi:hypothetical protein
MIKPFYLLDSPGIGSMIGNGLLFIVLPVAAIVLLVWLFIKYKNKRK